MENYSSFQKTIHYFFLKFNFLSKKLTFIYYQMKVSLIVIKTQLIQ